MLCGFCIWATSGEAQMMTGDIGKDAATLRLVAARNLKDGAYTAGIEIVMSSGSHTYWKMPGEAGVPPVFSFDGSQNVRAATVLFPVPTRIVEEGLEAFGYGDRVVFPVTVTPQDGARPSVLHADVTYAVCNKICIPAHGTATLALPIDMPTPDVVAPALAAVPIPMSSAERGQLVVTRNPTSAKPSWTLAWTGAVPIADMFANAPEGYFFETRKSGPQSWTLTADQMVAAPKADKVPVELTLARAVGGLVTTETLDVGGAAK